MGAHKNSSRRMNSAYVPNSQSRIPTRVRQRHVVTTDLPTLGTNPNSKQHGSTTQEAMNLGDLQWPGRTVRTEGADCPRGLGGPSASTWWTVCPHLADYLPNFVQPKSHDQTDRTKREQEHNKNLTNCWLKASSRTVRQGRMNRPRGAQTAARARLIEGQLLLPFARSPEYQGIASKS
jgi:hypothetical protein